MQLLSNVLVVSAVVLVSRNRWNQAKDGSVTS